MQLRRCVMIVAALVLSAASVVRAQAVDTGAKRTVRDTVPRAALRDTSTRRDSIGRDSTGRDTLGSKPLVNWASDSDSVATALMKMPGYRATRYQGQNVIFDAQTKALQIEGKPAAVSASRPS